VDLLTKDLIELGHKQEIGKETVFISHQIYSAALQSLYISFSTALAINVIYTSTSALSYSESPEFNRFRNSAIVPVMQLMSFYISIFSGCRT
jgi:hypothetical protein